MLSDEEATRIVGATLITADGDELGDVDDVRTHAADNRAAWAAVTVDGTQRLVPLDEARIEDERLVVRYERSQIVSAPVSAEESLDEDAAERLFSHYGINESVLRDNSSSATEVGDGPVGGVGDPREGGADDASQGHP